MDSLKTISDLAADCEDGEVQELARACISAFEANDEYHPKFLLALDSLIFKLSKDSGELDAREKLLLLSLGLREKLSGANSLMLTPYLRQLTYLFCFKRDLKQASMYAERLVFNCSSNLPPQNPQLIDSLYMLAAIEHKLGHLATAERFYIRVLKNLAENSQQCPISLSEVTGRYQMLLKTAGREAEAASLDRIHYTPGMTRDRVFSLLNQLSKAM